MSIVPGKTQDLLTFCDEHEPIWEAAPTAIGLTALQVTGFKNLISLAKQNYLAQQSAMTAARAATVSSTSSIAGLRSNLADLLRFIKAYAEAQPDPSTVYAKAQIPPPKAAGPSVPPGIPTGIEASLENDGAVTLRWKAPGGPSGNTVWTVVRKLPGETGFTFCGTSGSRVFSDETLPAGSANVQYMIRGCRGQTVGGPSLPFTVQFGTGSGGLTIAAQFSEESRGRLAA